MLRAGRSELPAAAGYSALCAGFCPSLCDKTLHFVTLWDTTAPGDTQGSSHLRRHHNSSEDFTKLKSYFMIWVGLTSISSSVFQDCKCYD